jgi:hypothetical protein
VLVDTDDGDAVEPLGLAINTLRPSSRTAVLAVFHDTANASAIRGHRQVLTHDGFQRPPSPRRDSFARDSAALLVSWRHTCPQPVQR